MTTNLENNTYQLDLKDCITDCADNLIFDDEKYDHLPKTVLESFVLEAIESLIDDFCEDPQKYIKSNLQARIDQEITSNLDSIKANERILGITAA